MDDVRAALAEAAPACLDGEPVAFAYLFGSHATGRATARSDVDVAVHLVPNTEVDTLDLRLAGAFERAAGVGPVEVVVLDEAPLALAGRVREHGQLIYCRDDVQRVRYESLIGRMYHDFRIARRSLPCAGSQRVRTTTCSATTTPSPPRSTDSSLAEDNWIEDRLAEALADAARFRNLPVHQYADIDDRRVVEIMRTRLDDIDAYVDTIAGRV